MKSTKVFQYPTEQNKLHTWLLVHNSQEEPWKNQTQVYTWTSTIFTVKKKITRNLAWQWYVYLFEYLWYMVEGYSGRDWTSKDIKRKVLKIWKVPSNFHFGAGFTKEEWSKSSKYIRKHKPHYTKTNSTAFFICSQGTKF